MAFEALEIKFGIDLSLKLVFDAYNKFQTTTVDRYYILSTASKPENEEWQRIQEEVTRIKNVHGCQVIVNGLEPSLKYYLRCLVSPSEFIINYTTLLETDKALKFEHKAYWNTLVGEMT